MPKYSRSARRSYYRQLKREAKAAAEKLDSRPTRGSSDEGKNAGRLDGKCVGVTSSDDVYDDGREGEIKKKKDDSTASLMRGPAKSQNAKFHSNVRHDFYSTNKGIKPIRSGKRGPNIVGLKIKNNGDGTKDEPTNELNIAASHNIKVEPNTDEGII